MVLLGLLWKWPFNKDLIVTKTNALTCDWKLSAI